MHASICPGRHKNYEKLKCFFYFTQKWQNQGCRKGLGSEVLHKQSSCEVCPTLKGLEFKVSKQTRTEGKTKAEETYLGSYTMSVFKMGPTLVLLNPSSEFILQMLHHKKSQPLANNLGTP